MGMIYRRGKVWWIKYYRNGKPYRESTKSPKEADAKRLLKKREGEISEGKLPGIHFDKVRFDELAEDFLTDYRINGKEVMRAQRSVGHLRKEFEGWRVVEIDTPKIRAYIQNRMEWTCKEGKCGKRVLPQDNNGGISQCPFCGTEDLEPGASNATINRELAALKRMFNLAARQTPPKMNQIPYIPMLKENNTRKGFFEYEEFLVLRDGLPGYLKPVVTFAYHYGWRKSEVLGLTWDRVDLKNRIVRLDPGETKNEEGRTIYLYDEVYEMLSGLHLSRNLGCPYVFNYKGNRIASVHKAWTKVCRKAGLQGKIFHDFRRTAVRNMVRAGVPERVAMMISGHKTRTIFERYNIVSEGDLREAAQKMQGFYSAQDGHNLGTITGNRVIDFESTHR